MTQPSGKWETVDEKFVVKEPIRTLLTEMSEGRADLPTSDLIKKYNLFYIPSEKIISKHIEKVLNYSKDVNKK